MFRKIRSFKAGILSVTVVLIFSFFLYKRHHFQGQLAILANDGTTTLLEILDVQTGQKTLISKGLYEWPPPCWAQHGETLIFGSKRDTPEHIFAVDIKEPSKIRDLTPDLPWAGFPTCDTNSDQIVFLSLEAPFRRIYSLNLKTGERKSLLSDPDLFFGYPAFSPDGKSIAFISGTGASGQPQNLSVLNVDGSGLRQIASDADMFSYPEWSPQGDFIAYRSNSKLNLVSVTNDKIVSLEGFPKPGKAISWGSQLVYSGAWANTGIYSVPIDPPSEAVYLGGDLSEVPVWSQSGILAFASQDGFCFFNCGSYVYLMEPKNFKAFSVGSAYKQVYFMSWAPSEKDPKTN